MWKLTAAGLTVKPVVFKGDYCHRGDFGEELLDRSESAGETESRCGVETESHRETTLGMILVDVFNALEIKGFQLATG